MGYLLIDNRESGGVKEEYDTKPCRHCRGALKVFHAPYTHQHNEDCAKFGCDHEQYYCSRCNGMLCRWCGRKMARTGVCDIYLKKAEELRAKLERDRMWSRMTGALR